MSWSIQKKIGTPDKMKEVLAPEFDAQAKNYAGKPEEQDVLAAKASVMSWLNEVPDGQVAMVEANGSRGAGWLSIKVECSALKLLV